MNELKGNLLLVDDEVELLLSLKELFEIFADKIYVACNGEEALRILSEKKIDCIVSDIKMPVMDGITFLKTAKERGFQQHFIFFSGHGTEQLKKELQNFGALDLVMKPNILMLETAIRKHMAARIEAY